MITQRLSIVVLAVAVCFVCMGCRAEETGTEKNDPELMQCKVDEDSSRMQLLATKLVQEDLRLTDDQLEKLDDLFESHTAQAREIQAKLYESYPQLQSLPQTLSLSQEESEAMDQKIKALQSLTKKFHTKSFAVLTPDQTERLKQIQLQTTMPGSLQRPEIIKVLHLSEEQLKKIRTLRDQMHQRVLAKVSDRSNPDQEDQEKRMIELLKASYKDQEETTNRTLDILTPEQRTELEKLTGKKIDMTRIHNDWIRKGKLYFEIQNGDGYRYPSPFARKNEENSLGEAEQ